MGFEFIIFDLDNTLYPRDSGVMQAIRRRIQIWMCDHLGLSWEEAAELRRNYLRRYGTTMGGLRTKHDIDPHDYLEFVHDIPLEKHLSPNKELDAMLASIPLRKVIYTNATTQHARRVLGALDVAEHFERIIGIDDMKLRDKSNHDAYERMLTLIEAQGPECIMVEDSPLNLPPAKALGMTTILVDAEASEHADFMVESVLEVERTVAGLLRERQNGHPCPAEEQDMSRDQASG